MMDEINIISEGYKELFGNRNMKCNSSCHNRDPTEDISGLLMEEKVLLEHIMPIVKKMKHLSDFTEHFITKVLPVPEIFGYLPEKYVYFLQDLGDDNLYTWLHKKPNSFRLMMKQ